MIEYMQLTALEQACLSAILDANWPELATEGIVVVSRRNTGVGRYTQLFDRHARVLKDGSYGANYRIVEMESLAFGLDFQLLVAAGRTNLLEIVTPGDAWDGVERPFIVTS
jgi:hypothetical protein